MKRKPKDMSDPRVLRAEAARTSEELDRILRGREFESKEELEKFMQGLVGKSFDELPMPEPTPQDKAQDLVYDAWEERSNKRRTEMARKALELWPDCADAYCLLAETATSMAEERRLLEAAVAAGERAIGPEPFKEDVGRFWGIHSTRPYMRARFLLAGLLWHKGETEVAIKHARELLRLNPDDNQGVRYSLVGWLLAVGNNRGAVVLLDRYDEATAGWEYARALLEFRTWGDADRARDALERAFKSNDILPEYLIALRPEPGELPDSFSHGTDDEAMVVLKDLGEVWQATPGALDWLRDRWLSRNPGKKKR
jgi:tetratricopeptide (TPR) repeat protein